MRKFHPAAGADIKFTFFYTSKRKLLCQTFFPRANSSAVFLDIKKIIPPPVVLRLPSTAAKLAPQLHEGTAAQLIRHSPSPPPAKTLLRQANPNEEREVATATTSAAAPRADTSQGRNPARPPTPPPRQIVGASIIPSDQACETANEDLQISLDSDDEEQPPAKKIKTEVVEGMLGETAAGSTAATTATTAPAVGRSAKAREKAKIALRLEEIRLRRRLMELEDEG